MTLAGLCLVLPRFTTTEPGAEFSPSSSRSRPSRPSRSTACSSSPRPCATGTSSSRSTTGPGPADDDGDGHADPPTDREALTSLGLLVVALVAVVGLAKVVSPAIEDGVSALGYPHALGRCRDRPARAAAGVDRGHPGSGPRPRPGQPQPGAGLGDGLIGLTIPTLAVVSIWLDGPLDLGLEPMQMVLLAITVPVAVLTVVPGRAKPLAGGVHLVLLAAFVFLSIQP